MKKDISNSFVATLIPHEPIAKKSESLKDLQSKKFVHINLFGALNKQGFYFQAFRHFQ